MNKEGHLKRAEEIYRSIMILKDDENNLSAVVELAYGCAIHYFAYGCERRYGTHSDIHAGLPRLLRKMNENEIADMFERLDTIRHGRWYGGKGNGETLFEVPGMLERIVGWSG